MFASAAESASIKVEMTISTTRVALEVLGLRFKSPSPFLILPCFHPRSHHDRLPHSSAPRHPKAFLSNHVVDNQFSQARALPPWGRKTVVSRSCFAVIQGSGLHRHRNNLLWSTTLASDSFRPLPTQSLIIPASPHALQQSEKRV